MREIKVYNTLHREKEVFKPIEEGKVKMYVCGVTPYNHPHIGNARPFITWDVIRRYLEHVGYHVTLIQNFTDVDDKIINTANAEKVSWDTVSKRYIEAYFEVMDKLHIRRATLYPRVSTHMPEIIRMIETLIEKGYAYVLDNDVYYSVEKFEHYGQLSGRSLEDMMAGARIEVNDKKRNPMDFALWKGAKPGEPSWESPWGPGRPGWHIECSAMSNKYLGENFDFHGGGSDLIFPHHENELAQSEACTGHHPMVNYWLHNGFITINQEKMSKSLNNFFLVRDILDSYAPDTLRYFILSTHYRSPLDFSDERLNEAERSLERLGTAIDNVHYLLKQEAGEKTAESEQLLQAVKGAEEEFETAMSDDFNTALATSAMFAVAKEINIYTAAVTAGTVKVDKAVVEEVKRIYSFMTDIIGVLQERWEEKNATGQDYDALMDVILSIRQKCREEKNWALADAIRDQLMGLGIVIEDSPQGARWKKNEI